MRLSSDRIGSTQMLSVAGLTRAAFNQYAARGFIPADQRGTGIPFEFTEREAVKVLIFSKLVSAGMFPGAVKAVMSSCAEEVDERISIAFELGGECAGSLFLWEALGTYHCAREVPSTDGVVFCIPIGKMADSIRHNFTN